MSAARSASSVLTPACVWCGKAAARQSLGYLAGAAVRSEDGFWSLRGLSADGPDSRVLVWDDTEMESIDSEFTEAAQRVGDVVLLIGGDPDPESALDAARVQLSAAREAAEFALRVAEAAVLVAAERGMTEVDITAWVGVNRTTVRKWLGK